MSNKNKKRRGDAFSDLSVEGMDDRYGDRNSAEVRKRRASELDGRIRALLSKKKDLSWAREAISFCAKEERENKDVFALANEAKKLPEIKEEAEAIIKADDDAKARLKRIADEKAAEEERIRREKAEKAGSQSGGKNAFEDLNLTGMGKYNERNAEAHKLKRAADLDARIRAFAEREKNSKWIEEADDFCAREELANKDIFNISKEAYRLPLILQEAKKLKKLAEEDAAEKEKQRLAKIAADKAAAIAKLNADAEAKAIADKLENDAKIANAKAGAEAAKFLREKEAEEARLKIERENRENADKLRQIQAEADQMALREKIDAERAEEARLRKLANEKARIAEQAKQGDELIDMLASSPRSKFWCDEVDKASEEIGAFPREARILMKKIPQLEELVDEAKNVREAVVFDKRIEKLADVPQNKRNASWAQDVINCEADLVSVEERLLKELTTLKKLLPVAKRAKYENSIKTYEKFLRDASNYDASKIPENVCDKYDKLNDELRDLEYDPEDYISDFGKRWSGIGASVAKSRDERAEQARLDKIAKKKAEEAEAARQKAEADKKRAREEEMAREKVAEEYRLILATIESGSFDDKIADFEAMYKNRSSVGFSLAQRIENFEKRMVDAKNAVSQRKQQIKIAMDLQKSAERDAAEAARKKAEAEAKRRELLDAMRRNIALIVSLAVVILASGALVTVGLLVPDLQNILLPAAVFLFVGYFVSGFGPIVLGEMYNLFVSLAIKAVCAVAGLVLTFIPQTIVYGSALFGVVLIGSAVECLLITINDNFCPSAHDSEFVNNCNLVSAAVGASLILLNMAIENANGLIAVIGIGVVLLAANIYSQIVTGGENDYHWIFIGISAAVAVAGLVLTFINRDCVQLGIFLGIVGAVNFLASAIGNQISDYDESQYITAWSLLAAVVAVTIFSTLMYFKYWGKADYVVSSDGTLLGVFVHDDKETLYIPEEVDGITINKIGFDALDRISLKTGIWGCKIKTIVLPKTIVEIEPHAFSWCNMPTVVLNEGLKKIGSNAFYEAYTTRLGYPEGVEVTEDMPYNYIPSTVEEIAEDAFLWANITGSLKTPEACKTIGSTAFYYSSLTEIDVTSATSLGNYPFSYSNVKKVRINDSLTELPKGIYANCEYLVDFNLPSGIEELPDDCFRNCESITEVILPESVTRLGHTALGGCKKLRKLDLRNVIYTGTDCFKNIGQPIEVYFGAGFKELGSSAFWGSTGKLKIHYAGTQEQWNSGLILNGNINLNNIEFKCECEHSTTNPDQE